MATLRVKDPLARPVQCPACACIRTPFTVEGVLFDWCPICGESLVPIRRPQPEIPAFIWNGITGPLLSATS